jgi:two-component system response regulator (stage 0 sporulation protein F)
MLVQFPATFDTPAGDRLPSSARDLPPRERKHALRALVVDDEPLIRWAIAETLHADGYDVEEAGDADGAVRVLFDDPASPDLVLLDLRLPDCADLSLLETVRRLVPGATVVLMTAFGTPDIRERARGLGAAGVLDKPFDVDGLAGFVAALRTRH